MGLHKSAMAFLCTLLVVSSCNTPVANYESQGLDTPLSEEQLAAISNIPLTTYNLGDIILPNGKKVDDFLKEYGLLQASTADVRSLAAELGPQAQKNIIIGLMAQRGSVLTTRSNFVYPEEPKQGNILRPAQNGLAYSYGQKDFTVRAVPPAGKCKQAAIYGLDCSGFIYQLATNAGLSIPLGTANTQRKAATWDAAFKKVGFGKLKAEELGQISPSKLETGDIIYWFGNSKSPDVATHIGIVLQTSDGQLGVFHSPGSSEGTCEANYGDKRGPIQMTLNDSYWFGGKAGTWGVTRFVTDISGKWRLFGRCQAQSTDAFALDMTLTNEADQSISASGNGTDYDGSPMSIVMTGTYNKATNVLNATLNYSFPTKGASRVDQFEHRLSQDDTGYFPTTDVSNSGGCPAAVRLVSQEKASLPRQSSTQTPTPQKGLFGVQ